jgi:FemAB-related protein (PEP-CTERM system-associated)
VVDAHGHQSMRTFLAESDQHGRAWQAFVERHPNAENYHRWGWKKVIENSFGWPTYYLAAAREDRVAGILPLVWQNSRLFGSFLTSLPFFNYGGVLAESGEAEQALAGEAISLAKRIGADFIELRHRRAHPSLELGVKTNKVAVELAVEPDADARLKSLRKETRNLIRKAQKSGLKSEVRGEEALDDFYEVFARNMRDLGTPVYAKAFFREIWREFPRDTHHAVVRYDSQTVAASFMSGFRDRIEVLWSSSLRKYLPLAPNMLLYWTMLGCAADKGYRVFDFGRSTAGSGPHRFKLQWSSAEAPLQWQYWVAGGNQLPEINPHNPKFRLAIWTWQRLPLALTKALGPKIVRCLP